MRKRLKLSRIAEKITGYKPKIVTTNFKYFVMRTINANPKGYFKKLQFYLFLILVSFWYWIPQANFEHKMIYIPNFFLNSKKLSIGFLVHEFYHLKFPDLSEDEIVIITNNVTYY